MKSKKEDELKLQINTIAIGKQAHPAITSKLSVNFAKIHKFNKHKHGKIAGPFQKSFSLLNSISINNIPGKNTQQITTEKHQNKFH